jgi:hypothetical protein
MSLRRRRPPQYLELTTTKNGTFAASITRVSGAPDCVWRFEDGEEQVGDSCSKVLDGHEQIAILRIAPKNITLLFCDNMSLACVLNLRRCVSLASVDVWSYDFPGNVVIPFAYLPRSLRIFYMGWLNPSTDCVIADLPDLVDFSAQGSAHLSGKMSELPATLRTIRIDQCPLVEYDSISQCVDMIAANISDNAQGQSRIDAIILDIWQHRASFTYAGGITCNLDGNNATPSGNVTPPEEGTDWHLDGETWIPLTPGAMVFDLVNDVNGEGFNFWNITVT